MFRTLDRHLKALAVVCLASCVVAQHKGVELEGEFDFIVVGGGTAGNAVASRLSESGKYTVLLLQDGPLPDPMLEIPALTQDFWDNTSYTRVYQMNTGLRFPTNRYITGRALGGTSNVNALFMNRAHPKDFENWVQITGDQSWRYSNMLKYFKKVEDYHGEFPSDQHGYDGPITISRPSFAPGLETWLAAGQQLGYPIADPNGPQEISFCPVEYAKRRGRRVSSFLGYILPILWTRKNLKVVTNASVNRVLFEGHRAVGVAYDVNITGTMTMPRYARATKEVILCAGVMGSPVILMKSGVGPLDVLNSANIQPVKILPVGRNLHDRPAVFLDFVFGNRSIAYIPERDLTPEARRLFEMEGEGPFTTNYGTENQAFMASSVARQSGHGDWADIHLFTATDPRVIPERIVRDEIEDWEVRVICLVFLARPNSRGFLTLNLTDLNGPPVINFQYLSHPIDRQIMLDAIRETLRIYEETPAYRAAGARYTPSPLPSCAHLPYRSDAYWNCYMETAQSGFHGAGSCRMGRDGRDPKAVVDSKLRVIGIQGLRVVDASIMPQVSNANPHNTIYAIAEKASDDILRYWNNQEHESLLGRVWPFTSFGWTRNF